MPKLHAGKKARARTKNLPEYFLKRLTEGGFILILTLALFVFLSLSTYQISDPGWSHASSSGRHIINLGGTVGAYLADALYLFFGYCAYLIPVSLVYLAWFVLKEFPVKHPIDNLVVSMRITGLIMAIAGSCGLLSLDSQLQALDSIHSAGGLVGETIGQGWYQMLNLEGASLVLLAMFLVGITWFTGLSWLKATEMLGYYTERTFNSIFVGFKNLRTKINTSWTQYKSRVPQPSPVKVSTPAPAPVVPSVVATAIEPPKTKERALPKLFSLGKLKEEKPAAPKSAPVLIATEPVHQVVTKPVPEIPKPSVKDHKEVRIAKPSNSGSLPGLDLLDKGTPGKPMGGFTHQELENLSRDVEQHLLDFGIQADVVAVHPGPVVTRFELQLAAGVKVSKLTALSKDLARSLSVISVRVVEVIPGKTVVGLELPNHSREIVRLSDVLLADVYQHAHSPLTLALGVDIAGHPMVVDLGKMPHLLVAGTTGSGKSVGINAMILSILLKATPDQVRLIMIDPKMLELSVYDGIPHLLTPVVTDMKEAASALRWCVEEMERRYKLMSALGVRNLAGYNVKIQEARAAGKPILDPLWKPNASVDSAASELFEFPYIMVVIDELADMMMVVGKKVEQLIARIAQKARAAGIHMILATQRPSVDVLTGLIKSNIPTRISFQVSSKIDSRTILDQQGAEQLLGHGDMLYLAPGSGAPLRVHGAYVDDKEVHRIANDWRARGEPDYIEEILRFTGDGSEPGLDEDGQSTEDDDPLYDQAVEFVLQSRKASISAVQRRLKIGYNRAARIIEEMERTGIVGPLEGGYRDVLVTSVTQD